jgi:uncharacterized protein YjbI with pentapeptide repeats
MGTEEDQPKRDSDELPDDSLPAPHGDMAPEQKGALLQRYVERKRILTVEEGGRPVGVKNRLFALLPLSGVTALNFSRAKCAGLDFRGATLIRGYLRKADFRKAEFTFATLHQLDLRGADLSGADLRMATISYSNLNGANLEGAKLHSAKLQSVSLVGANLSRSVFQDVRVARADFAAANFNGASLNRSIFVDTALDSVIQAHDTHVNDVVVDWRSAARSLLYPDILEFLIRTGMPLVAATYFIDSLRSERNVFRMLQTVFISYGGPDQPFAHKLRDALERNGVRVWEFERDAIPGEPLSQVMFRGVNDYDRVVLICSKVGLLRPGVVNEIQQTFQRETRLGGEYILIPVRLDGYIFSGQFRERLGPAREHLAQQLVDRVVANFEDASGDESKFNNGVAKLLRALERKGKT